MDCYSERDGVHELVEIIASRQAGVAIVWKKLLGLIMLYVINNGVKNRYALACSLTWSLNYIGAVIRGGISPS